jgi:exodeoxyribonuclease V alpha subunit
VIPELRQAGVIGVLDDHFARALRRLVPGSPAEVLGAAALVSHLAESGHVCLALGDHAGRAILDTQGHSIGMSWPHLKSWTTVLRQSDLVATRDDPVPRPLVLDDHDQLYLYRFWLHEQHLARRLLARLDLAPPELDVALLADGLSRLFGPPLGGQSTPDPGDGQRLAAVLALTRRLCVITGGPGTGKTSTVVKILALLLEQAHVPGPGPGPGPAPARPAPLNLTLLAPTGKAAARLSASIKEAKSRLDCTPELRSSIPDEAMTIHRRLGSRRSAASPFWHHANNPIPTDVVLVDEASMVDLALMSSLVAAVPPNARLILMGDREQLASVAPGSVLADICNAGETPGYSQSLLDRLADQTGDRPESVRQPPSTSGIWDSIAHLTHSFRFGAQSGIGALARAISAGDAEGALAVLADDRLPDVQLMNPIGEGGRAALVEAAVTAYTPFANGGGPAERLEALARFRVLCAHRTGPSGVQDMNLAIAEGLRGAGRLKPDGRWYEGRPILVTTNSYPLKLFNGDIGILLPTAEGNLRAHFVDPDGQTRTFAPARLPDHETVFAMTVHKSQGSEFTDVVLVLPEHSSRVLTRELLYTAVTRARRTVTLHATPELLREAIRTRNHRASGLRDLLWRPQES